MGRQKTTDSKIHWLTPFSDSKIHWLTPFWLPPFSFLTPFRSRWILIICFLAGRLFGYSDWSHVVSEKTGWYEDAKFGLFIHWGLYSVTGGYWSQDGTFASRFDGNPANDISVGGYVEWMQRNAQIPLPEYEKIATVFDWSQFNAQDHIDLCFASGQKFIVITSKHHDGFAMYRSQVDGYNIGTATQHGVSSGRDPLKELAEACQATKTNGSPWEIKMGVYYSHDLDWHEPGGNGWNYNYYPAPTAQQFQDYLDSKVKPQVTELLTNYGDIGVLWFDLPAKITPAQAADLRSFVHSLSPDTVVSGRIGHGQGDFVSTGDNQITGTAVSYLWEACATINDTWGYRLYDENWKTKEWMIDRFIQIISKGGNYLLNVGPKADGSIPAGSVVALEGMGSWIQAHGEAIYNTERTPYIGDKAFHHDWGCCTVKDNNLYLHVMDWPEDNLVSVPMLSNSVNSVTYLVDLNKAAIPFSTIVDANGNNLLNITVPSIAPDAVDTIIKVACAGNVVIHPYNNQYDPVLKRTTLSAQNFQLHGYPIRAVYDSSSGAITNWCNTHQNFDSAVWHIDVPATGTYNVKITYAVDAANAGLNLDMKGSGGSLLGTFTTVSTGGFDTYAVHDVGTVTLQAGAQEFEIGPQNLAVATAKEVMKLKNVMLTLDDGSSPVETGSLKTGSAEDGILDF